MTKMPESSISEQCAICQQPITTSIRMEHIGPDFSAWTVMLCEAHGAKVLEMVTGYYTDEAIKHGRTLARTGRDEEGGR